MQNLLKRPESATDPSILAGLVVQPDQPNKCNLVSALTKFRRRLVGHESYNQLVERVQQKVREQYGGQLAAAQKDISHAIETVLEGVAKESDEINQRFLLQVEGLEEERCSRERACYEAAAARVSAACLASQSASASHSPAPFKSESSVSSMMTQYSDPFRASYQPPMTGGHVYATNESAPSEATSSNNVQAFEALEDDFGNGGDEVGIGEEATLPANPLGNLAAVYGIRLVPKVASPSSVSIYHPEHTAPVAYSRLQSWSYAVPQAQSVRLTSPTHDVPSTGFTAAPAGYNYSDEHISIRTTLPSDCIRTQVAREFQSSHHFSCDEFGRMSSGLA